MKANWSLVAPKRRCPSPLSAPTARASPIPAQWPRLAAYWKEQLAEQLAASAAQPGNTRGDVLRVSAAARGKGPARAGADHLRPGAEHPFLRGRGAPQPAGPLPGIRERFCASVALPGRGGRGAPQGLRHRQLQPGRIARDREDFADCAAYRAYRDTAGATPCGPWGQSRVVDYLGGPAGLIPTISTGTPGAAKVACARRLCARYA